MFSVVTLRLVLRCACWKGADSEEAVDLIEQLSEEIVVLSHENRAMSRAQRHSRVGRSGVGRCRVFKLDPASFQRFDCLAWGQKQILCLEHQTSLVEHVTSSYFTSISK